MLRQTTIKLLSNFLQQRTAKIKVIYYIRLEFFIMSRVLQGSVLRPTIYSLFTNYTTKPELKNFIIMFADDVTKTITTDIAKKQCSLIQLSP